MSLPRTKAIFDERDRKLAEARERRAQRRREAPLDQHAILDLDRAEDTALRGRNRSAVPVASSEEGPNDDHRAPIQRLQDTGHRVRTVAREWDKLLKTTIGVGT